jgi:phosphohistidine phosphatase SixA
MKRLVVICRHGEVVGDYLTQSGRAKVEALAERIKQRIGHGMALVLYSTAPHVAATADVFADKLAATFREASDALWAWNGALWQGFEAAKLVERQFTEGGFDTIIMITHSGGAEATSEGYGHVVKAKGFDEKLSFNYSDAVIVLFEEKRLEYLT